MNIICTVTGHRRSRKRVRATALFSGWKSVCPYCGRPMVRVAAGQWLLETAAQQQGTEAS